MWRLRVGAVVVVETEGWMAVVDVETEGWRAVVDVETEGWRAVVVVVKRRHQGQLEVILSVSTAAFFFEYWFP